MQGRPSRQDEAAAAEVAEAVTVVADTAVALTLVAADISQAHAVAASMVAVPALPAADDIPAAGLRSHTHRAAGPPRSRAPPAAIVFAAIAPQVQATI